MARAQSPSLSGQPGLPFHRGPRYLRPNPRSGNGRVGDREPPEGEEPGGVRNECQGSLRPLSSCSPATAATGCGGRTPDASPAPSASSPARGTTTASWAATRGSRWSHAQAWRTARRCVPASPRPPAARDPAWPPASHSLAPRLPCRRRCSRETTCTTAVARTPKHPGSCPHRPRPRPCPRP